MRMLAFHMTSCYGVPIAIITADEELIFFPEGNSTMYENESIEEACNQIERSTIDKVFPLFKQYYYELVGKDKYNELEKLHKNNKLSWHILSSKWDDALNGNNDLSKGYFTLQKIFDLRRRNEFEASNLLIGQSMILYYEFENKSVSNIYATLRKSVKVNLHRFIEKINEFDISEQSKNIIDNLLKSKDTLPEFMDDTLLLEIFPEITCWEELFDYVSVLDLNNNKYDIDLVYETLMTLHCIRNINPKDRKHVLPATKITTCSMCWRPALVRGAKKKYSAYCPIHGYGPQKEKSANKKAYERSLVVCKEIRKDPNLTDRLTSDLMNLFPKDVNLLLLKTGLQHWWEIMPPTDISPLPFYQNAMTKLWKLIPNVRCFLEKRDCSLNAIDKVISTLMPLPEGADGTADADYRQWLAVWNADIRFFLHVLARAEIWLATFSKVHPNLEPDDF